MHERGRDAPLVKASFDDQYYYIPAPEGVAVGDRLEMGLGAVQLQEIFWH